MMKKNLLGLALLSAVSLSQVAVAQEYDNRWYISGSAGGDVSATSPPGEGLTIRCEIPEVIADRI